MMPTPILPLARNLGDHLERMVRIVSEDLPKHWTDVERREVAEKRLFGERR